MGSKHVQLLPRLHCTATVRVAFKFPIPAREVTILLTRTSSPSRQDSGRLRRGPGGGAAQPLLAAQSGDGPRRARPAAHRHS